MMCRRDYAQCAQARPGALVMSTPSPYRGRTHSHSLSGSMNRGRTAQENGLAAGRADVLPVWAGSRQPLTQRDLMQEPRLAQPLANRSRPTLNLSPARRDASRTYYSGTSVPAPAGTGRSL